VPVRRMYLANQALIVEIVGSEVLHDWPTLA
jgi:hypothetical protein